MSERPSWQAVYGGRLPESLPPVPRVDYPYISRPTCAENCSGRHEPDGYVTCDHCKVPAYQIVQHEWRGRAGIYFSLIEPMNGSPEFIAGTMTNVACIACGEPLRRR
mgnify:CR=1 FL=1